MHLQYHQVSEVHSKLPSWKDNILKTTTVVPPMHVTHKPTLQEVSELTLPHTFPDHLHTIRKNVTKRQNQMKILALEKF